VIYSDLGYILLGELLERAAGRSLADLFRERIAVPLGLGSLGFHPGPAQREQCASTEDGNQYERKLAASIGNGAALTVPVRASIPPGEVHDGNAWGLGGAAGHAGLFGTAREVAILAREFLGRGRGLFQEETLSLFRRNLTPGLEEGRTFGWKLAVAGAREAQGALPESAFGHTGFTGTSLWIDPDRDRIYVLLTNRIHPRVTPLDMNRLRWRFHEIAGKLQ
jgi:CubicO group peptidase (beta-lactamase class C family)